MNDIQELARLAKLGRQAERGREKFKGFIAALLARIAYSFLSGWLLMLGIWVVHHNWWPAVPPMGYWTATLLAFLWTNVLFFGPKLSPKKTS